MEEKTKRALDLIVEKARIIQEFGFREHVMEKGLGFRAELQADGKVVLEFGLPDSKDFHAFVQVLRFFYRHNEPTSFANLHKLAADTSISDEWRTAALELQRRYNAYLDTNSLYTVNLFEGEPNRRAIFHAGMDGGLDHANNAAQIKQFQELTRDEIRTSLFFQELTAIFLSILKLIDRLAEVSEKELRNRFPHD